MSDLPLLGPRTASQENNIFMAKRQFYRPERPWKVSSVQHPSLTFILEVSQWKYLLNLNTTHFLCLIWLCLLFLTTKVSSSIWKVKAFVFYVKLLKTWLLQFCSVLAISYLGAKHDFEIWAFKVFCSLKKEKHLLEWLLEAQTWISKLETIHRRFITRHELGSSASVELKKMR